MECGESRLASGAACAPRLTAGRSTGRPEGSAPQATKQTPRRWQAIERIGESLCEAESWGVCLALHSRFRIIDWAARFSVPCALPAASFPFRAIPVQPLRGTTIGQKRGTANFDRQQEVISDAA